MRDEYSGRNLLEEKHLWFQEKLSELIDRFSKEEHSYTPDIILAEFLKRCLQLFGLTIEDTINGIRQILH